MTKQHERKRRRAVRPRDAATVVLYRMSRGRPHVLMGLRHSNHKFMPDNYVFPGGRVDRSDGYADAATELRPHVAERLAQTASPHRARALAMAAVRETFEETGLILGKRIAAAPARRPTSWQPFFDAGYGPTLDRLEYIWRAVTPPFRPIRFNARFFLARADDIEGTLASSGELIDLKWLPVAKARDLPTPGIQQVILNNLEERIGADGRIKRQRQVPVNRTLHGRRIQELE